MSMSESDLVTEFFLNNTDEANFTYLTSENEDDYNSVDTLPPGVTILYIIVGVIGNLLVCLAVLLDRKLQNLTNYFLLSLAITDLLVNILIMPARMILVRYKVDPPLFPLCYLYLVGDDFITAASAIHICFISLERYFAIKNPLNQRNLTKRRVALKIGLVWLISFFTIIPYMTLAIISSQENKTDYCATLLSKFMLFDMIVLIEAMVIVVMIVIVTVSFVLTNRLLHELMKRQQSNSSSGDPGLTRIVGGKKNEDSSNSKQASQSQQSVQKARRFVWIVSFTFIICMTPYTSISMFYYCFPNIFIPPIVLDLTAYLLYANSIVNPIIYTIFNKTFRNDFKNILLFKYKKNQ